MKFVLKYYGSGMDGRDNEVCVPVEADSKKQVLDGLRNAAEHAAFCSQDRFVLFGHTHYLHNFLSRVSTAQMQMMTMFRKSRNLPEPRWISAWGNHYTFNPIALEVLTPDEWFAAAADDDAVTASAETTYQVPGDLIVSANMVDYPEIG